MSAQNSALKDTEGIKLRKENVDKAHRIGKKTYGKGQFLLISHQEGKEGVLRLYTDLAGGLAQPGGLSAESTKERSMAGLHTMTDAERKTMSELNTKYKNKFGFPFVICVRENKKEAILMGLETRLKNSGETEAVTGVNEVKKICNLRLRDLVDEMSSADL